MLGLFLIAAVVAAAQPAEGPKANGQVTAAVGPVTIVRNGESLPASPRTLLFPGDKLVTGAQGGAGAFLFAGQSIYLGDSSALDLPAKAGENTLTLARGEARVINASASVLNVAAGKATGRVERGILRAESNEQGSRFWSEDGQARIIAANQAPVVLPSAQQVNVPNAGPAQAPVAADPGAWQLNVNPLQLSGAADSSRYLRNKRTDRVDESLLQPGQNLEDASGAKSADLTANQPTATAQPNTTNEESFQPVIEAQPNTASSAFTSSLAFNSFGASSFGSTSGGINSDAQQQSLNPSYPGNIHLITAQTRYTLNTIQLKPQDLGNTPGLFPTTRTYYSVGLGAAPKGPILTNFLTGTNATPRTLTIPHFNAYVVKFDQYGIPDTALNNNASTAGISGLLGAKPTSPQIVGATPLVDKQAVFNPLATFAFGEFALQSNSTKNPQIDVRRSDQDRQIIKSPTGNDNLDKVTLNPQVGQFQKVKDNVFFPQAPYVLIPQPNSVLNKPTYGSLSLLQKAAATTLLADSLFSYAKRTGQTRFTLGGQIVDITGYRLPKTAALANNLNPAKASATTVKMASAMRPPLSAFGPNPVAMRGVGGSSHAVNAAVKPAHH